MSGVRLKSPLSVQLVLISVLASVTVWGYSAAVHFLIESFGLLWALLHVEGTQGLGLLCPCKFVANSVLFFLAKETMCMRELHQFSRMVIINSHKLFK